MKTKLRLLFNVCLLSLAVGFTACEGDQGEIGPKGDTGNAGVAGTTGANGANGTGFDELTQFGNVEMTISGTVNEDEFSETIDFIYMPMTGVSENSIVYKDDEDLFFRIGREHKGMAINGRSKDSGNSNSISMDIVKEDGVVELHNLQLYTDVLLENFKAFPLSYYSESDETFSPEVTNYSYNATTGKLTFDFSYTIPANYNNTNNDIIVTGKADVTVFESLNSPA